MRGIFKVQSNGTGILKSYSDWSVLFFSYIKSRILTYQNICNGIDTRQRDQDR